MNNLNPKLAGIIVLIVGMGFLGWGFHMQKKASASESWPSVTGEITTSKVNRTLNTSSSGSKWHYRPTVEYTYKVDGLTYTNDRIDFNAVTQQFKQEHKV